MISRLIRLIAISCCFFSYFGNCLNFTQSVSELIIRDLISKFDLSNDFDTCFSPFQTTKSDKYQESEHHIETENGYQLKYYRITTKNSQKAATNLYPVLLHHGLLSTWNDWTIQGSEKSLAYRLADEGFDVWMANSRGNTYTSNHNKWYEWQRKYWDFTFHEMGTQDLSKGIDYILRQTSKKQLIYIGHSQGTTTLYALLSTRPEYNDKIFLHIGVAPVAGISHSTSSIKLWRRHIFRHYKWAEVIIRGLCKNKLTSGWFKSTLFNAVGHNPEQYDENTMCDKVLKYNPAGTSIKNMVHMAQLIDPGKFTHYDSDTPYNISQITAPAMLYYGPNDLLANKQDVLAFYQQLPNPLGCEAVAHKQWNHIDFLYGIDANTFFNDKVVTYVVEAISRDGFVQQETQKALQKRKENSTLSEAPQKDVPQKSDKCPYLYLREIGKSMNETEEIINRSIKLIKEIIEKTSEQVNEIVQKSFLLINTTTHADQTPDEFLKELEDFYHIINTEQPDMKDEGS